MAKFCSQCGRPLQEGEICNCQQHTDTDQEIDTSQESSQVPPKEGPEESSQAPSQEGPEESSQVPPQGGAYVYGQIPPQGGAYGYSQVPPQGGAYVYGQMPPQGGAYGYGQIPPQGGAYGYGQIPPQGGAYGYVQIPPQGEAYGYVQIPPQGGTYGYGQIPPQGGAYGYGQIPPQGGVYGYGQPYGGGKAPKQPNAAGIYVKGLWKTILDAWKKPADTLSEMIEAGKTSVVLGICGIQSLLFSLIFLVLGFKMNSAVHTLSGGFISVELVSTPALFLISLIGAACILACWGAVAMLFCSRSGKRMNYIQGLGVAAAKALAQMPYTAVTILFVLIFPVVGRNVIRPIPVVIAMLMYSIGNLQAYCFVPAAIDDFLPEDKNKRVGLLSSLFVVNLILTVLFGAIFSAVISGSSSFL